MSHLDFSGKSNFGAVGAERFAGVLDSEQSWFTSMSDTITIELQEQEFWEVSCSAGCTPLFRSFRLLKSKDFSSGNKTQNKLVLMMRG